MADRSAPLQGATLPTLGMQNRERRAERYVARFGMPDAWDLGEGLLLAWDPDGHGFLWHHPEREGRRCTWAYVRFVDGEGHPATGHTLERGGMELPQEGLTVGGSLLCPERCGVHGWIREGRWVPA